MSEHKFNHEEQDFFNACGVTEEDVQKALDEIPDELSHSKTVELMCKAGNDPVKNVALFWAFGRWK